MDIKPLPPFDEFGGRGSVFFLWIIPKKSAVDATLSKKY
jgi:hypothetical protein